MLSLIMSAECQALILEAWEIPDARLVLGDWFQDHGVGWLTEEELGSPDLQFLAHRDWSEVTTLEERGQWRFWRASWSHRKPVMGNLLLWYERREELTVWWVSDLLAAEGWLPEEWVRAVWRKVGVKKKDVIELDWVIRGSLEDAREKIRTVWKDVLRWYSARCPRDGKENLKGEFKVELIAGEGPRKAHDTILQWRYTP